MKLTHATAVALATLTPGCAATALRPTEDVRRIEGVVVDAETRSALSGVRLLGESTNWTGEAVTDAHGRFAIAGAPRGEIVFLKLSRSTHEARTVLARMGPHLIGLTREREPLQ